MVCAVARMLLMCIICLFVLGRGQTAVASLHVCCRDQINSTSRAFYLCRLMQSVTVMTVRIYRFGYRPCKS